MPRSGWSPKLVPYGADQTIYLVVDSLSASGTVYREAEVERTDFETIIADFLTGQFNDPVRVVAFSTFEHWSDDVSEAIATEIQTRYDIEGVSVPEHVSDFADRSVVTGALAPHRTGDRRIHLRGQDVKLGPKPALALALAVHELATNAVKYGALSTSGQVEIVWSNSEYGAEPGFRFTWTEILMCPELAARHGPEAIAPIIASVFFMRCCNSSLSMACLSNASFSSVVALHSSVTSRQIHKT
jgi:hypothetical protein